MRRSSGFLPFACAVALTLLLSAFLGASPCLADNWVSTAPAGMSGQYNTVQPTVASMASYGGATYAGTQDMDHGCEVWRYSGEAWSKVAVGGFGNRYNVFARSMRVFGTKLYVGTGTYGGACEVWAYDGASWTKASAPGFGNGNNSQAYSLAVHNGSLYAGTANTTTGGEVWRYDGGTSWSRIAERGFDNPRNTMIGSLCSYGGRLFAGTYNTLDGCDVWSYDGASWTQTVGQGPEGAIPTGPGFGGGAENFGASCMTEWNGKLYLGVFQSWDSNVWEGGWLGMLLGWTKGWAHKVWSFDGVSWSGVTTAGGYGGINGGLGTYDDSALSMGVYGSRLVVTTKNEAQGCQVWLFDGGWWTQANTTGFGTGYNDRAQSHAVTGSDLFVGTRNERQGAEVWRYNGSAWERTAGTGFAASNNYRASSMVSSGDALYAGTASRSGGEVWRTTGAGWSKIGSGGLSTADNLDVSSLAVFNSRLYAGTRNDRVGGRVYVLDGGTWTQVSGDGFGDGAPLETNYEVSSMAVHGGRLWAGTHISKPWGCMVYSYDGTSWTQENGNGFGDENNLSVSSLCSFGDSIFAGTLNQATGCEIWKSGPTGWQRVNADGFGDALNSDAGSLVVHGGRLYAGVTGARARVYRYEGGSQWTEVSGGGIGDPGNIGVTSLASLDGTLYAGTATNPSSPGCQVWRYDGTGWASAASAGFGDFPPGGDKTYHRSVTSMAVLGQKVYAGTENEFQGCNVFSSVGPPGSIASIDPARGYQGQTLDVAMTGSGTHFSPDSSVLFSGQGISVNSVSVHDREHLTANITVAEDAAPGPRDVNVRTVDDLPAPLAGGFTVRNPRVVSVLPAAVDRGDTVDLTINGSETRFTGGDEVRFSGDGITVNSVARVDDLRLRVNVTVSRTAAEGARDVTVSTPGMVVDPLVRGLTVGKPIPRVDSISPSHGGTGYGRPGDAVTVRGDWFGAQKLGSSEVTFNGKPAMAYREWGMTEVRCVVPAGATSGPLVVKTAAGAGEPVPFRVVNTIPGTGRRVDAGNRTTVTFQRVDSPGNTRSVPAGTPVVDGFTPVPGTAREVNTTADYTGEVTVTLSFAGAGLLDYQEESVVLLHEEGGGWADVTTGRDPEADTVTGKVSSLSRFVVAIPGGTTAPAAATWYLAEGSTDHGFATYISIENPNDSPVSARITYMTTSGPVSRADVYLPALSQTTVNPAADLGARDFSTKVECLQAKVIAVDRTMAWTGAGAPAPGAHSSIGLTQPAGTWYLPEGSSDWGFETWVLVQNPNDRPATCRLTYMIEGGGPVSVDKLVPANGRSSFHMADDIGARDASVKVQSDLPIIAERSMYRNNRREGHNSVATAEPNSDYYLAEGTTGWGFTTYVLVQNPHEEPAEVSLHLMTPQGPVPGPTATMPGLARKTFRLNDALQGRDCSIRVHGSRPIVAERAMYWNSAAGEAMHDSIGVPGSHRVFYLPDGQTTIGHETWTLVQNPNPVDVEVEITYMTPTGSGNIVFVDIVPAGSRKTYDMSRKIMNQRAAIMVRCLTPARTIMAERSMYWNGRASGTCTVGGYSD